MAGGALDGTIDESCPELLRRGDMYWWKTATECEKYYGEGAFLVNGTMLPASLPAAREFAKERYPALGYSTAGFPALLFGHLLGLRYRVDELWAMSPLTAVRVDDANRDKVAHLFGSEAGGLERVEAVRDRVARAGLNPDVVTDVSALAPLSPAQVVLSFSRLHAMDAENARRVAAADPAVKLAALEDTRHHTPLQYWVQERGLVDAVLRGPVPSPHRSHHVPKQIAYDTEWLERQREIRVNHVERMRSD